MEQDCSQYNAHSWTDPRVEVRDSNVQGRGGFARELICAGEAVVIIGGTPMTDAEFAAFAVKAEQFDAVQIGENLHLVDLSPDPRATNGSLNHSCNANLWMQDEVTLVTRCDIQAGEELTVDYALFTTSPDWQLELPCQCGTDVCRHTITGNDWLLPDVQARYRDHFSPYINRRIEEQDDIEGV